MRVKASQRTPKGSPKANQRARRRARGKASRLELSVHAAFVCLFCVALAFRDEDVRETGVPSSVLVSDLGFFMCQETKTKQNKRKQHKTSGITLGVFGIV